MHRLSMFKNFTFLMVATAAQAALVDTRFITEADIPVSATRRCMLKGFTTALVQQFVTFEAAVVSSGSGSSADRAAIGLLLQWPVCLVGLGIAHSVANDNISTLSGTSTVAISSDWVHDKIMNNNNIVSRYKFSNQYKQLRLGAACTEQVCEPKKIYSAYNTMLEEYVKKRAFIKGYFVASSFGPLPPIAAMYLLINLGLIQ